MIKVTDIAYAKFSAPDLTLMETFLLDFGLVRSARTETTLYMRAAGPDHHVHITELGDPSFVGLGFHAASAEDLTTLSQSSAASDIEEASAPGGGQVVRLTDPDGFDVECFTRPILERAAQEAKTAPEREQRCGACRFLEFEDDGGLPRRSCRSSSGRR